MSHHSKFVFQTAPFDGQSPHHRARRCRCRLISACSSFPEHEPDQALVRITSNVVVAAERNATCSWQSYVDYHKCVNAKGEDYAPCKQFKRVFRSLCPSASSLRRRS